MAVSDGQLVNSSVTNAAFLSRLQDSDTIGVITLDNSGSATIADVQQVINNLLPEVYAVETIAGSIVSSDNDKRYQVRKIVSSGGQQNLSLQPFGTGGGWTDGVMIELIGTNDLQTMTIQYSDTQYGAIINGDLELKRYQKIVLRYDSFFERWIEVGRN